MAVLPKASERQLPDEGEHILKLQSVEIQRITSKYPDGKADDGKADILAWSFISSTKDADGAPQELRLLTPPAISGRNRTGKLARKLVPGLDPDADAFDPDELVGRIWTGYIAHETAESGKVYAHLVSAKPYKAAKPAPKPEPEPEPEPADIDPFADE